MTSRREKRNVVKIVKSQKENEEKEDEARRNAGMRMKLGMRGPSS
ncbi:Protein CBG27834 [Caenorhabditis briggsae]|uniref:Protein CBG27834 n=1 Tax=Caenorhabditis briggsae TaxID=6238 RepID=B6IKB6_CAEBR|nr:Protein CBG27834 [Caenorhabditis briggsae]CAS00346.1 Protein CBG27834 [Caenorhabditis briggsae]